jgi:ferredoxin--NADP+ reductase
VPQGELTPLLYKLGPGDTITARKVCTGRFTLDTVSGRTNHLLLATVTGVAPYVSYVGLVAEGLVEESSRASTSCSSSRAREITRLGY